MRLKIVACLDLDKNHTKRTNNPHLEDSLKIHSQIHLKEPERSFSKCLSQLETAPKYSLATLT